MMTSLPLSSCITDKLLSTVSNPIPVAPPGGLEVEQSLWSVASLAEFWRRDVGSADQG